MRPRAICTIGYEGGTVAGFIRTLKDAQVELILDIRAARVSLPLTSPAPVSATGTYAAWARRSVAATLHAGETARVSSEIFLAHMNERTLCSISVRRLRSPKTGTFVCCASSVTRSTASV